MAIRIDALRSAATRSYRTRIVKSFSEATANHIATAFLCHSHADEDLAKGLQVLLSENGLELYIDWQDNDMPETPNKETAQRIKQKITSTNWFLFLATPNSTQSRWCPWEIGYADSTKHHDKIFVIPTIDSSGQWYGNEYLQLYRQITEADAGGLAAFPAGRTQNGTWVKNL